jgi:hypothetical protein
VGIIGRNFCQNWFFFAFFAFFFACPTKASSIKRGQRKEGSEIKFIDSGKHSIINFSIFYPLLTECVCFGLELEEHIVILIDKEQNH